MIDTHCHIHETNYPLDADEVLSRAHAAGVNKMICVGTDVDSSRQSIEYASLHKYVYSAIGVHPHETKEGYAEIEDLIALQSEKVVAVGEIGLDYYYTHSPRSVQIAALEAQIDWALRAHLPIIFHVRDAFDDFWPVFDNFHGIHGVLHSFTDTQQQLEQGLERGLFIGINGISTFTRDTAQQQMFASIPLDHLMLETDAPFLTPTPLRGKVNEPAFVKYVAQFQADARQMSIDEITAATTANAEHLFSI